MYISRVVIKFHVKHVRYRRGKAAQGFRADWIGTLVAMAHGKHKAPIDIKTLKGECAIRVRAIEFRPTSYIFDIKQCLVVPFINSANHAPGVQTGHTLGAIIFHK